MQQCQPLGIEEKRPTKISLAKLKKAMEVIIFAHHGIYPKHRENLLNDKDLLEILLEKKNVKAYINGHDHDGGYGVKGGLHCWTVEGMLDYMDKTAYAIADVYTDRLEIKGFGRTKDRILTFR